jgi:predicted dehydrogenase
VSRKFRVCVIGLGGMGRNHIEGWGKCKGAKVVAICDVRQDVLSEIKNKHNVENVFTDFRKAVTCKGIDIVSVCTHVPLHYPIVKFALKQKKHVLCEKPLTMSVKMNSDLMNEAKKNKVKFAIGFQSRASDTLETMAKMFKNKLLGSPIYYLHQNIRSPIPAIFHDEKGNGGPIIDLFCHFFDFWKILFNGQAKRVKAVGSIFGKDKKELKKIKHLAYDTFSAQIEYPNGNVALINNCWGLPRGIKDDWKAFKKNDVPIGDWIWGPKGIICGSVRNEQLIIRTGCKKDIVYKAKRNLEENQYEYIRRFLNSIISGKNGFATAQDATDSLKVGLAIKESIKTGKIITIK